MCTNYGGYRTCSTYRISITTVDVQYKVRANLIAFANTKSHLLFRVLYVREPFVLSIPNGNSRMKRYSNIVRILYPFNFSFRFSVACARARVRARVCVCARVSIYRVYYYMFRHECAIIRPISFKIQIREPYDCYNNQF